MPENIISFHEGAGDIPLPGEEIWAKARFNVDLRIPKVSTLNSILQAFEKNTSEIKQIIGRTIKRVYGLHGLKTRSGNLKKWASNPQNMDVTFVTVGHTIVMFVRWTNRLPYSRIHMWGGIIRPKHAKRLAFMGDDGRMHFKLSVTMPERPYIWLDNDCLNQIERVVQAQLVSDLINQYVRKKRAEGRATAPAAVVAAGGRRMTKHRARKTLWRSNKYTQSEARHIVEVIWGNPKLKEILESLIRDVRKGQRIVHGMRA